jgi:hypothetical protein
MRTLQTGQIPPELIGRRQFSVAAALALLGGAAIAVGCGGSKNPNNPTPTPPPSPGTNLVGSVENNHPIPHVATITAAQLSAGAGLTLDISNGLHNHTVALTAAQVGQIAAKAQVSKASSTNPHSDGSDPHSHMVTFN